jgi:enoyl-CoA hydratase/carnithine racemase
MYEQSLYAVEDPVETITLNRPERLNAWTDRMGADASPTSVAIMKREVYLPRISKEYRP